MKYKAGDILIRYSNIYKIPNIIIIKKTPESKFDLYSIERLTNRALLGNYLVPDVIKLYRKINDLEKILYLRDDDKLEVKHDT